MLLFLRPLTDKLLATQVINQNLCMQISPSQYNYSMEATCRVALDQRQDSQQEFRLLKGESAQQSSESMPVEERHEGKVSCELCSKPSISSLRECSSLLSQASATDSSYPRTERPHNPMFDTSEVAPSSTSSQSAQSMQRFPGAEGAGEYSSLISELAEKFGCEETLQCGRSDMHCCPRKADPLSWFCGGLVSPHLRASQRHFQEAVKLAIEMVNARGDLADRLDRVATAINTS